MRNHRQSLARQCARTRESHPQNRVMLSPLVGPAPKKCEETATGHEQA